MWSDDQREIRGRHDVGVRLTYSINCMTSLPMKLYDILTMVPELPANNPYNRLLTAIELMEMNDENQD